MNLPDMQRSLPFPFPDDRFPAELGAVIQRTILGGIEPVRIVIHDADGDWAMGDGVNDPNEPGSCIVTHVSHLLSADPSLAELASMPAGFVASRTEPGDSWSIIAHRYDE